MIQEISVFIAQNFTPLIINMFGEGSFLAETSASNPLLIPLFLVIIPALILFGLSVFVDFIKDSWKMPFGIVFDLAAILLYTFYPILLIPGAFVATITYALLGFRQKKFFKWIYILIGFLKMLVLSPAIPVDEGLKIILVFLPIYTIIMFFLCITD